MLARLLEPLRSKAPVASVPPRTRVYAVGDIHGRFDLLRALHESVARDAAEYHDVRRVLVYVGDYVDRGPESRETIDHLLDHPLPGFETVHLMGNHERAMLDFLDDTAVGPMWMRNGGGETMFSYGVDIAWDPKEPEASLARMQAELHRFLPARHRAFLESLKLSHVEGDYLFVHAGVRPDRPLDHQEPEDLLWIREEFLSSRAEFGKVVVHGHTISEEPVLRPNRIGIDTGAFATGRLTCLVLADSRQSFLQTGA